MSRLAFGICGLLAAFQLSAADLTINLKHAPDCEDVTAYIVEIHSIDGALWSQNFLPKCDAATQTEAFYNVGTAFYGASVSLRACNETCSAPITRAIIEAPTNIGID